ncbi:MAG: phosphohistidine phosphatase SixA [Gammaproteobacteria bacterium]
MKLYLVRHGEAFDKADNPERPLNEAGRQAIEYLAVNLGQRNVQVDWVWHSGILRAEETARILIDQVGNSAQIEVEPQIAPDEDMLPIARRLSEIELDGLLVSHLPFIGLLTEHLLKDSDPRPTVNYYPGTLYCLEKDTKGRWHYCWKLDP